jgi:hypothetical protein
LPNAARDFVYDDVVMRSITTEKAAETDDCIVFLGFGQSAGSGRNFEGTGHADDLDIFFIRPRAHKRVVGAA